MAATEIGVIAAPDEEEAVKAASVTRGLDPRVHPG
jgi:hypothetical protein